ncbi:MAG: AI-2E family transporter [Acidobacteriia bacterium]|nr:AI-2E family transporter [Terriglobia bacterium]
MLGIDRRAARYAWTVALTVLLLYLVYLLRKTIFVFIVALLFAYLLSPLVNLLDRVLPIRARAAALALAYIIFVGAVAFIGAQIGSRVVEQANTLVKAFPAMLKNWQNPSPGPHGTIDSLKEQAVSSVRNEIASRSGDIFAMASQAGLKVIGVASDLIYVVIIPILAFFFLKDGAVITQHLREIVNDGPRRALVDDVMADIHLLLAHYVRALVFLCLAVFGMYSIVFAIIGVPFPVLLGTVGGLLEFIPMIGPMVAGAVILIVAGVSGAPVLSTLVFLLAYRMLQDYVVSPHLMGRGIQLHPVLIMFGVFAGAELAGIAGTFLSVPVLALVRVLYIRFRKARLATRLSPEHVRI